MQRFNKVVALLLCVVMLIGFVPVSALAADGAGTVVDAAIIFSDLHTSSGDYKEITLKGILNGIKNAGVTPSSVTSAGDAFSVNEDSSLSNGPYTGYTSTLTGYIQSVFAGVPVNYVWSDHDRYAVEADGSTLLDKTSRLVYGAGADGVYGTDDDGNYYIYSLSMGDLCSYDRYSAGFNYTQSSNNRASKGFTSTVAEAIENFKADAAKLNKDRPLFITSHQPLFDNRNDNAFAEDWFDAINEVAEGMDVAFFYGHNHKYDTGSDYYYAKGSKMNVATADNWNWNYEVGQGWQPSVDLTSEQKTLNFTHMCAGYMAPSSTGSTSGTTREGVAVAITIYDDAINYTTYNSSGVYTGNYALNETVTRSFASASAPEETVPETTEPSVPETSEPENENPEIGEELFNSVTIGGQSYEEKTVYVRVDSFEDGEKYLLIGEDGPNNGNPIALVNNNGSDITAAVTVNTGSITVDGVTYSNGYIELDNSNAVFTASGSASNGYTLKNGSHYIGGTTAQTLYSGSNSAVRVTYDSGAARLKTASGNTYYLYYSTYGSETWKWSTSSSSSTSSRAMYIYKEVSAKIPTGPASVTYTMQASDLEHNLVGDNNTALLDYALLADGMEATALPTGGKYTFGISDDNHDIIESIDADGTITFTGEHGSCRVKVAYTWTDGDQTYTVYKYVTVSVVTPNNYPEYPDEGAVKVGKTGTGIDFQSSGIAQVEISASGVPMQRGVDVIVMLDMSSSMTRCIAHDQKNCAGCKTRRDELADSLTTLLTTLQNSNNAENIRVAIADFNGMSTGSEPYARDDCDVAIDTNFYPANHGQVYTNNTNALDATAFVSVANISAAAMVAKFNPQQGTNYDYAFDAIYQLGEAIKSENAQNGLNNDLIVLFMSDGAPNQYNYYTSIGGDENKNTKGSYNWKYWLTGTVGVNGVYDGTNIALTDIISCTKHAHYYNAENGNQHWMANAIKGNPDEYYTVIRKNASGLNEDQVTVLQDLEPTDALYGKENMYKLPGLGATMYSIAFDPADDGAIPAASMVHILKNYIPSSPELYIEAAEEGALVKAFGDIATDILYAAYNARYVDQMGDDYNLQMKVSNYNVVNDDKTTAAKTITPTIEVISYDIYTAGETIPAGKHIGDRKGTYTVLETVTFNADGTEAYSDKKTGNILIDGVICAQSFWYNTNATAVAVEGVSIPTGMAADGTTTGTTNLLPSETFYWKMGTVKTSELAMRYYVYLEGSMEGTRKGGSYPTNEYATLYYDNYLGNPCRKDTVSPVMPWKEANVSYAFYLVDENGNIIVNQTTGQTGSFANKIAVTNPVVYETVLLNSDEEVSSIDIASLGVLPEGYTLYDYDGDKNGATYTVNINSNTTGSWNITTVKDVATTYVTQYDPNDASAYSNARTNNTVGDDYTHTVVWFAVLWKVQALPDTVVIDYGLPVDISVLANDMFGENGKLAGVGAFSDSLNLDGHDAAMASGFGTSYTGTYGTAKANTTTGKVRYTPANMQMNGYDKFAYAVNYTGNENAGYYYDTVTVIPATTIYYEDSFLTFAKYNADGTVSGTWDFAGEVVEGATQSEDRPGQYSLTDANNIYGYDGVNLGMSQFSLGQARKVHVDANSYATAAFTFYGTGFDVISMTSNTSGVLSVEVKDQSGASVKKAIVNTYYGYKREPGDADNNGTIEEGEMIWVPAPDVENAIYQVPVIQIEELTYGKYDVLITATYMSPMDKTTDDGYDLYLDAIRIYDPAYDGASDGAEDSTIEDAYLADHEGWPSYIELRNGLISKSTLGNADTAEKLVGEVFIDGNSKVGDARIADYVSYGPNNEVYLASGQSIAFIVNAPENIDRIHIGISSADGNEGTYTIKNIARYANAESVIEAGQSYGEKTYTVNTSTDMYYDMTGWKNDIVVITNTGDSGIISLTNIKSTYISNPANNVTTIPGTEAQTAALNDSPMLRMAAAPLAVNAEQETTAPAEVVETAEPELTYVYMTAEAAQLVVANLNADAEEIPDETEPTVPDETEPEETEPTAPDETEPEETEPTVPEETEPEVFEPAYVRVKLSKTSIKVGQKVLVTVTTSADVDHVIINGTVVTAYATGFTGNRIWKRNVTGTRAGTLMIDVTCCNASDVAAQTVTQQVKVNSKTVWDYIFDLFD